ncbi:MAG: hypothetical protein R3F59_18365 [Myxococcota bacterium]
MWIAMVSAAAFGGCGLKIVGPDPLTGNVIVAAPETLGVGQLLELDHHSKPTGSMEPWVLAWVFVFGGVHDRVLSASDTTIDLALGSGAKLHGALVADAAPVPQATATGAVTQYTTVFALSQADVEALAASEIAFLRVSEAGDQVMSFDASKVRALKKYPARVQCVLDEIGG